MIRYSTEFSNFKKGFLLIEVLLYLALFGIIVGGSASVFYSILEGSEKVNQDALISSEAEFILGKINWMLSGDVTIEEPLSGESGDKLRVSKNNFPDNPLVLEKVDDDIVLQRGGNEASILNNSLVEIEDLNFENIIVPGVPVQNILRASFVISGNTYSTSRLIH